MVEGILHPAIAHWLIGMYLAAERRPPQRALEQPAEQPAASGLQEKKIKKRVCVDIGNNTDLYRSRCRDLR